MTEITVNEASRNMDLRPVRKNTKNPASTMTTLTTMPTVNACCSIFFCFMQPLLRATLNLSSLTFHTVMRRPKRHVAQRPHNPALFPRNG